MRAIPHLALAALVVALSTLAGPAAMTASAQEEAGPANCNAPGSVADPDCDDGGTSMDGFDMSGDGSDDDSGSGGGSEDDSSGDGSGDEGGASDDGSDDGGGSSDTTSAGPGGDAAEGDTGDIDETESSGEEEPGGPIGWVIDAYSSLMNWMWDSTVGFLLTKIGDVMQQDLLALPSIEGPIVDLYEDLADTMRPAILLGTLIVGLLMMLRTTNYDLAYAGFSALPRLVGVALALAFLPEFMTILSQLADGISETFFPGDKEIKESSYELYKAGLSNMAITNFLNVILLFFVALFGGLLVIVAILKSVFFYMLFIAGPFALIASLLPGLQSLAASWFRGVIACAAIPSLWAIWLQLGQFATRQPEAILGDGVNALGTFSNGAATTLIAILILYAMYRTPFKVLEWAFESYTTQGGAWRNLARSVAVGTITRGVSSAIGGAIGGAAGAASKAGGGAAGAAAGGGGGAASRSTGMPVGGSGKLQESQPSLPGMDGRASESERTAGSGNSSSPTNKYIQELNCQRSHPPTAHERGDRGGQGSNRGSDRSPKDGS